MKHKIVFISLIAVTVLSSAGCYKQDHELLRPKVESEMETKSPQVQENYSTKISVKNKNLLVELATTDESREQGLSYRQGLRDDQGMLFDFTNTKLSRPDFWMKDMNFNIDIIWINNGKIIAINEDAAKPKKDLLYDDSKLPVFAPPSDITHVLEVSSGWCKKNNILVGDIVSL